MNDAATARTGFAPAVLSRARAAVSYCFFLLGALTGVWAVHIPIVQARLNVDPAVLGLALFMLAFGTVITMPLTGAAIGRFGSRPTTASLALAYAVLAPIAILSPTTPSLFANLFFFGAAMGGLDVAMNTQVTEVEAARGRPTMSSFHGFFSVGALSGASAGSLLIALGWGQGSGATLIAFICLLAAIWAAQNLLPSPRPVSQGPKLALPNRAVLGLGLLTFLAFAGEGAITDWGALYLTTVKGADAALAGAGFAIFSVAMTVLRLFGDGIVKRVGAPTAVIGGGALMTIGMAVALASPGPLGAICGYAITAVGAANLVPVVFSAAARTPGVSPAAGVAAVTTLGYSGFLVFPPFIGFLARSFGLSSALAAVALIGVIVASMARLVRR